MRIVSHVKSETFLRQPEVQKLLHSNQSFDLVFTSAFFGEESLLVFGHVFSAPMITLIPAGTWSSIDYVTGNSLSLAFAPEYADCPYTDKMTLMERIENAVSGTFSILLYYWYDLPNHDAILQRTASSLSPPPPSVYEMARDVALTFVNVRPLLSYPKPISPNIVMIGGIHLTNGSLMSQVNIFKQCIWEYDMVLYINIALFTYWCYIHTCTYDVHIDVFSWVLLIPN